MKTALSIMDEPSRERIEALEDQLDYALNQARMLRRPQPPRANPDSRIAPERKAALHALLDRAQALTPRFLRALVRPLYLRLFYHRVFPEYAPQRRAIEPAPDTHIAHSGYAPMIEFKQRLCRDLSLDFSGLSVDCRAGLASVVLPVHNGARYVAESIESVLAQTYRDLELIVVDDGSDDGTPEILERFSRAARVRIIRQENRKLPAALNAGFAEARGEFFTWTSDDNRMHPEMLFELVGFLRANQDAEMVYADQDLIDEHGRPAQDAGPFEYLREPGGNRLRLPRDPGELNFVQNNYIGACFLYRAWTARILGPYAEDCFGFEDYEYWMRMNALFRIAHLGSRRPLYSYRLHPHSLTANQKQFRISERARYFMAQEEERRRFFADGFDIALIGRDPWLRDLARAYRRSGHNVVEAPEVNDDAIYHMEASRAFAKRIVVADHRTPLDQFATLRDHRLMPPDCEFTADSSAAIEYPLLATANRWLWFRQCSGRP